jgi:hypothetical protein
MYIETETKEDFQKVLKENLNKDFVIHYNCRKCDDEQVSEINEIEEETINIFDAPDAKTEIFVYLECTCCGYAEKFLNINIIRGIEIL